MIEYKEEKLIHTSDLNGPVIEDYAEWIIKEDPNILILDGEELVGTKQKRAANITMLIPAHSAVVIPISCVERRRWYYQGRGIMRKDRVLLKRSMAVNESLLTAESFPSDWILLVEL